MSSEEKVNKARKQLLTQQGRAIDSLPPTHIKRAAYEAGHVWAQMFVAISKLPDCGEWGWLQTTEGGWGVK